jgi:hypothetical protein
MRIAPTPGTPKRMGVLFWALALVTTAAAAETVSTPLPSPTPTGSGESLSTPTPEDGRGTPYVVEKTDNICGLEEPKQLSDPVLVDCEALLEVTPQIKQMKRDKVDPNSARGIQLRTEAEALIREKCESVQSSKGHCSVWKKIERRDGGKIADITEAVKKKITGS